MHSYVNNIAIHVLISNVENKMLIQDQNESLTAKS